MKIKYLICILLLLALSSCFLIRNECGFRNSKTYHFKTLKKNELKLDTTILKTDGVYLNSWTNNQGSKRYNFYRFFANGRVFHSQYKTKFPTIEDFNDIYCGSYGQFIINNDTIIIETHNASAGYVFHYFKSSGATIEIIGSKKRKIGKSKFQPNTSRVKYEFHEVDLTETKADW